jgi:restriction system protein
MSVWYYSEQHRWNDDRKMAYSDICLYCQTLLERDREDEDKVRVYEEINYGMSDKFTTTAYSVIGICPACGWWKYGLGTKIGGREPSHYEIRMGTLKNLDLADAEIPLGDVRDYLTAHYESRFNVNPQIFEEVVASVFRDHGYIAYATAYSGDGGIDVILQDSDFTTIGVQVKRYKNRISVAQIRELTGALVIGGHTRGVFVTTSEFQSGAATTVLASKERGYPIELIDAHGFFEKLKIAQLSGTREVADRKPWGMVRSWE